MTSALSGFPFTFDAVGGGAAGIAFHHTADDFLIAASGPAKPEKVQPPKLGELRKEID